MPHDRFRIVIEGKGNHHNGHTGDADHLARLLVRDLGVNGHVLERVDFSPAAHLVKDDLGANIPEPEPKPEPKAEPAKRPR